MNDWVKPGAKCVCIKGFEHGHPLQRELVPNPPEAGKTYTVARVEVCKLSGILDIMLEEVITKPFQGEEIGFNIAHFRPVVPQKTEAEDIALFRPLLETKTRELVE